METPLYISIGINVLLALIILLREKHHQLEEHRQRLLNRCLREELCDMIRRSY